MSSIVFDTRLLQHYMFYANVKAGDIDEVATI